MGRRWALRIVWELKDGNVGFRGLQGRCEEMSSSVLRERLRELVTAGLVETDEAGLYALSADGRDLVGALRPLLAFAEQWGAHAGPA